LYQQRQYDDVPHRTAPRNIADMTEGGFQSPSSKFSQSSPERSDHVSKRPIAPYGP